MMVLNSYIQIVMS